VERKYPANPHRCRNSPSEPVSADNRLIVGPREEQKVSTSYVGRQNLTMGMDMRRFTRLLQVNGPTRWPAANQTGLSAGNNDSALRRMPQAAESARWPASSWATLKALKVILLD